MDICEDVIVGHDCTLYLSKPDGIVGSDHAADFLDLNPAALPPA